MGSQISIYYNDYNDVFSESRVFTIEPYLILLGIRYKQTNYGIHHQCIQINSSHLYSLIRFIRSDQKLVYEFEDDITLIVERNENNIIYQLIYPEMGIDIKNRIRSVNIDKIGNNSIEIDYLIDYLKGV